MLKSVCVFNVSKVRPKRKWNRGLVLEKYVSFSVLTDCEKRRRIVYETELLVHLKVWWANLLSDLLWFNNSKSPGSTTTPSREVNCRRVTVECFSETRTCLETSSGSWLVVTNTRVGLLVKVNGPPLLCFTILHCYYISLPTNKRHVKRLSCNPYYFLLETYFKLFIVFCKGDMKLIGRSFHGLDKECPTSFARWISLFFFFVSLLTNSSKRWRTWPLDFSYFHLDISSLDSFFLYVFPAGVVRGSGQPIRY